MAIIKPFKGYRPRKDLVERIASRPYDVLTSAEAAAEAAGNAYSFYHIIKSEIDLPEGTDQYAPLVYETAKSTLHHFIDNGILIQDDAPYFYVYAQTMHGRTQYGLVACASVTDYKNNIIRKHELTRPEKEEDRKRHIQVTNFNTEPVFFTYPDHPGIDQIINHYISDTPEYDFEAVDGIRHQFWIIDGQADIDRIETIFRDEIPHTYIADGHHRTAAAAHIGEARKSRNQAHTGNEAYNYFLAVHFPASQLAIQDYNRVVKDLNGYSASQFLHKLGDVFDITEKGSKEYKPQRPHEFSLYLDGKWYALNAKCTAYDDGDPIDCLDVTLLSKNVLGPILDIRDLRSSRRVDFVGGIRGLGALKKRVDEGDMAAAFALYPVSMDQLIRIADTNNIMPPKVTWFEPKLRSGLVLHDLE